jgi:nicotinate-nucleotide--dimethylbenzimidazole phosphoribosyltransferase
MQLFAETIKRIEPIENEWVLRAEARQRQLTKPPGSLGRLESIACRLCAIQRTLRPTVARRRIVVFAADHGVTGEGVSTYPPEVTSQMVANFRAGGAAINALARAARAELCVVDIGVASTLPHAEQSHQPIGKRGVKFLNRRIRAGTRNIVRGAAMTETEMLAALQVGIEMAGEMSRERVRLAGLGEMGIGNTTSASAVTAALTGLSPELVTGRGTGADDATLARKIAAVEQALTINQPTASDAFDVLRKVGGLEIAGLCGLCLGACARRCAVITDGFIATAAVALAVRLCPAVTDYVFAGHLSPEPGHAALLELIGLRPILDLEMRLGEGTGAALAMNVIGAGVAAFREMATFAAAKVSDREAEKGGDGSSVARHRQAGMLEQ